VFGFSMGGFVALYLARAAPGRIGRVVTLGTKLRWRPDEAAREVQLLDPERIQAKVPRYAAELAARHGEARWADVLRRMAEMMIWMGAHAPLADADFQAIGHPVRLMVGDQDGTAGIEDTVAVHRLLPCSQLAVLPATPHPIDRVAPALLAELITGFFNGNGGR
jgi:pimeloyl-ACP methyl ester carboxylesterase